jgi:hypothetical protein
MYIDHVALMELVQLGLLVSGAALVALWLWARHRR